MKAIFNYRRKGNLPSTFYTFRMIGMDFSMKGTDSFVKIGALKVTLYLVVNEFLFVHFGYTVLKEMCTQCCLGSVSSWNLVAVRPCCLVSDTHTSV
jgi:hypothetical protein